MEMPVRQCGDWVGNLGTAALSTQRQPTLKPGGFIRTTASKAYGGRITSSWGWRGRHAFGARGATAQV